MSEMTPNDTPSAGNGEGPGAQLWRHKKGGLYRVVERLRALHDFEEGWWMVLDVGPGLRTCHVTDPIKAGEQVVAYYGVETDKYWVRPAWMFDDGRFERVES